MNYTLRNGLLTLDTRRILLRHVTGYHFQSPTLVITSGGTRESFNAGPAGDKIVEAMDDYFKNFPIP